MGYSVKWIEEHLGITRKTIRNYEDRGLLSKVGARASGTYYLDYSEEIIERIWQIKILQKIGFTVKQIRDLIDNPEFDFYATIAKNVNKLERDKDELESYIGFIKTIKITGRLPTVKEIGNIRYEDFMSYARENWNMYSDSDVAPYAKLIDKVLNKESQDVSLDDLTEISRIIELLDHEKLVHTYTIGGFYKLIAELQETGYSSNQVQVTVKLLYEYYLKHIFKTEQDGEITPQLFAKNNVSFFLEGDVAIVNEQNYGKDKCRFIAQAIAYFGGYDSIEDLY